MSHAGAPKATAQGTLAKTPFAHLMQHMMSRELTGTLAVWPEEGGASGAGQDRVLFERGTPVAMRSIQPAPNLAGGLLQLFERHAAPYAFYENQDLLGRSMGVLRDSLDPFCVLALGVRSHASDAHIEPVLRQLGARPVRVRVGFDVARLGLEPNEVEVVEMLRRRAMPINDALRGRDRDLARRVIYLLTLVKGLEALDASVPSPRRTSRPPGEFVGRASRVSLGDPYRSRPPEHAPKPGAAADHSMRPDTASQAEGSPEGSDPLPPKPGHLSDEESAQWDEFVALYAKLDDLNHYELLGVDSKTSTSDTTSAYFTLVKRWHPERISRGLEPLDGHLRLLFERITEAHEVLSSDDKRKAYFRTVQEGGGTRRAERMMADVVESAMDMQKAEVLLRRRAFGEALQLVEKAIAKSPGEAGNYATRGWLRLMTAPSDNPPLGEILADIDRTLADNDKHAKAHYYKGVVLKRRGEKNAALRHFQRASELDTRNIEAQREVRLARIRRQSMNPPKKQGLWGKLFSKD